MDGAVYVVVKVGVYHHETFGVYATLADARAGAERMLAREPDDYHRAQIVACVLGADAAPLTPSDKRSPSFAENDVALLERKGGVVRDVPTGAK